VTRGSPPPQTRQSCCGGVGHGPCVALQPWVLGVSGVAMARCFRSPALSSPIKIHRRPWLSIREKSPNLFLKYFLPKYLPFSKPKLQPRNLTTINETQLGYEGPNTMTLKPFQPALAIQPQTPGSQRRAKTQPGYFSFASSHQLRPDQHLSKTGEKNPSTKAF